MVVEGDKASPYRYTFRRGKPAPGSLRPGLKALKASSVGVRSVTSLGPPRKDLPRHRGDVRHREGDRPGARPPRGDGRVDLSDPGARAGGAAGDPGRLGEPVRRGARRR